MGEGTVTRACHMIIGVSGKRDDDSSTHAGKDEVARILVRDHGFVRVALADAVKRTARDIYDFTVEQLWGSGRDAPDLRYPRAHGPFVEVRVGGDRSRRCACCGKEEWDATVSGWLMSEATPQCYLTPRHVLQQLGTELGRACYEDTWVDIALRTARSLLDHPTVYEYTAQRGLVATHGVQIEGRTVRGVVVSDVRWPAGNEGAAIRAAGGALWRVDRPGVAEHVARAHASEVQPAPDDVFLAILRNDGGVDDLVALVEATLARMPQVSQ